MGFTDKSIWCALLCGLILLVSSCSTIPSGSGATASSDNGNENMVNPAQEQISPVIQPNPYLENVPSISGDIKARFEAGVAAMEIKNWAEAALIFEDMTVTAPKLSGPWVNLGIAHYQTDDFEAAETSWSRAIQINPMNLDAYNRLAILKRERGDFAAAETFYLNSLAKWPDNAEAHCNLGILYDLYMGLWPKALAEYQKCADLAEEPNRQHRGWIIDIERRIQSQGS